MMQYLFLFLIVMLFLQNLWIYINFLLKKPRIIVSFRPQNVLGRHCSNWSYHNHRTEYICYMWKGNTINNLLDNSWVTFFVYYLILFYIPMKIKRMGIKRMSRVIIMCYGIFSMIENITQICFSITSGNWCRVVGNLITY